MTELQNYAEIVHIFLFLVFLLLFFRWSCHAHSRPELYTIVQPKGCIHYVYHREVWGGRQRVFEGILKFFEDKRGDGKISKGGKVGDPNLRVV